MLEQLRTAAAPLDAQLLAGECELDDSRHRFAGSDIAAHRGNLAVDPWGEAMHEVPHCVCVHTHRHHDFHASPDMHARREPPCTRTDTNCEWVAGAARLEQR